MSHTQAVPESYMQGPPEAPVVSEQDLRTIASVPWVSIALAAHVLFLVIAWFIVPQMPTTKPIEAVSVATETMPVPPEPPLEPPLQNEWPDQEKVVTETAEQEKIVENRTDLTNEDATEEPNHSLAKNPTADDSQAESPNPNRGPSSAVGLAGGGGGGGDKGGPGGLKDLRSSDGPPGSPKDKTVRVGNALDWLADHQNFDGFWSGTNFSDDTKRVNARKTYNLEFVKAGDPKGDKGWSGSTDIGLTGLSLLAFAGAGHDHKEGKYKDTCRRALMYLRKIQSNDGCFGPKDDDSFVYNHAICTMAMAELYSLSGDAALKGSTERAAGFILSAQNEGSGWRYGVKPQENDTSVTGWMVLALKSCKFAGFEFESSKVYGHAAVWLDQVTVESNGYPKTGYNLPGSDNARMRSAQNYVSNPSMDAINIMTRMFMGDSKWDANNRVIKSQAAECARNVPVWEHEKIDYYYWYYASLALYQVDGPHWKTWESAMVKTLFANQRGWRPEDKGTTAATLDEHGSWDAVDAWSGAGGRVYATAINCLTIEVWTRYKRAHEKK